MQCDKNDIFLHLINVFLLLQLFFLISLRKILKIKGNVTIVTFFGPFHVSRFWQNNSFTFQQNFRFRCAFVAESLKRVNVKVVFCFCFTFCCSLFLFSFIFFVLFPLASRRFLFMFYFLLFFSCFVTFSILEVEGAGGGGENERHKKLGRRKEKTTFYSQEPILLSCRLVDQNNLATDFLVKSFNNRLRK